VNTRSLKDANVFFFFNEGAQPISHSVTLKATGKVEAWDPTTGSVSPVAATSGKRYRHPEAGPKTLRNQAHHNQVAEGAP